MATHDECISELIENVAKLRSHNIVLKKAFLEEQQEYRECERRFREQETLANAANEKLDSLKFHNTMLTQRIEQLQRDMNILKKQQKASWWPLGKTSSSCNNSEHAHIEAQSQAILQELQIKISENETLQLQLNEYLSNKTSLQTTLCDEKDVLYKELDDAKKTIFNLQDNLENRQKLYDELTLMHYKFDTLQQQFNEQDALLKDLTSENAMESRAWVEIIRNQWNRNELNLLRPKLEAEMVHRLQELGTSLLKNYSNILGLQISYMDSRGSEHILELFDTVSAYPELSISVEYLIRVLNTYVAVLQCEKGNPEPFENLLKNLNDMKLDASVVTSAIQQFSAHIQLWSKSKKYLEASVKELNLLLDEMSPLVERYISLLSTRELDFGDEGNLKFNIQKLCDQYIHLLQHQTYVIDQFKRVKENGKSTGVQTDVQTHSQEAQTVPVATETKETQVVISTRSMWIQTQTVHTPKSQLRYAPEQSLNSVENPLPPSSIDHLHERQLMWMAEKVRIAEARANEYEIREKYIVELEQQLASERNQRKVIEKESREKEDQIELIYKEQMQWMNEEIYKMQQELVAYREKEKSTLEKSRA